MQYFDPHIHMRSRKTADYENTAAGMVALLEEYGTEKVVVNSTADWGRSDPFKPPKTGQLMPEEGAPPEVVHKVPFENPMEFCAQSGKTSREEATRRLIDRTQLYEDHSALRGQTPIVA